MSAIKRRRRMRWQWCATCHVVAPCPHYSREALMEPVRERRAAS